MSNLEFIGVLFLVLKFTTYNVNSFLQLSHKKPHKCNEDAKSWSEIWV